jgi:hypothetical protein
MATSETDSVSADLAGFTDPEADEHERWARVEREALILCEPLARMIGHKKICSALDVSKGQLSRELSPHYENNLALRTALLIGRESQNEKLKRLIVCDGLGAQMPDWQRRRVSLEEELRAFKDACHEAGLAGEAIAADAARRSRSGR